MNEPIKVELVFECKDEPIARHCDQMFRGAFESKFIETAPDADSWSIYVNKVLTIEARRQEWYDYRTDDQGNRHVILNPDGTKKLLAPTVRIEPV